MKENNKKNIRNTDLFRKSESIANRRVAEAMKVNILVITGILILNELGVFIIDDLRMRLAYVISVIITMIPIVLIKFMKKEGTYLKYIVIGVGMVFIFITNILLTYHLYVFFIYPILLAALYYDTKLIRGTMILSMIFMSISQILGQTYGAFPDKNFPNNKELIVFGIVPKCLIFIALYSFMKMICERTTEVLADMLDVEQQKLLIQKNDEIRSKSKDVANVLLDSAEHLDNTANKLSEVNNNMIIDIDDILAKTENNVDMADIVNNTVSDISSKITDLNMKSYVINQLADKIRTNTLENQERIDAATKGMEKINKNTNSSKGIIEQLGKKSKEIMDITSVITDISEQTKLLSLNASIEAARAGEQGKGFAVVATEIHNLSEQTKDAVANIGSIITSVVDNTQKAVEAMENGFLLTNEGIDNIKSVEDASIEITNSNYEMINEIKSIYEISNVINDNSENVKKLMENMENAMKECLEKVKQASVNTQNNAEGANGLVDIVSSINKMLNELNLVISD